MPITTFLIDLDDTLYPPSSGIWDLIGERIDLFIHDRVGLAWEEIPALRRELYINYGTTMRGLVVNYHIDAEDYLKFVHEVPVEELIGPDLQLTAVLSSFPQNKVIFTNADVRHARRVLRALQLETVFGQIIDIRQMTPFCKPQPEAYLLALKLAGEVLPQNCLVVDDSPRNLSAAAALGFPTVLVGSAQPEPGIDYTISTLKELNRVVDSKNPGLSSE
jgi:putative hydrolase of the HAD superfamily